MSNKKRDFEDFVSNNMLKILLGIFALALILTSALAISYAVYFDGHIIADHERWGTFGDYLGGALNPILSFFALIAILLTIVLQNRDLKLTRDEMKESKRALKLENFERTFFEMLRLPGIIVEDITMHVKEQVETYSQISPKSTEIRTRIDKGRICFKYLREKLQEEYYSVTSSKKIQPNEYPHYIELAYNRFAENFENKVGHYFRTLYRIFKFVHESDPDGSVGINKKHYTGIARAMLSSHELVLLFYDCFYKKGEKFAKLIIEYSLFENMEFEKLFDKENHIPLFNKKAYGDEDWTTVKINREVPEHFSL